MTYEEWLATERRHDNLDMAEEAFGSRPTDVRSVVSFDPGVAVILNDGQWYTHIGRSEYFGTADEIRKVLWDEHAKHEVQG